MCMLNVGGGTNKYLAFVSFSLPFKPWWLTHNATWLLIVGLIERVYIYHYNITHEMLLHYWFHHWFFTIAIKISVHFLTLSGIIVMWMPLSGFTLLMHLLHTVYKQWVNEDLYPWVEARYVEWWWWYRPGSFAARVWWCDSAMETILCSTNSCIFTAVQTR